MTRKRTYTLRKRAESQERTRQRIVEAAMHLHEELGPRATTIRAIAERAGVQRLTVYRHFPDETAVFEACTAHWLSLNPPPEPTEWADIGDPEARVRAALAAYYAYYRRTEAMWTAAHRDEAFVPAVQGPMEAFRAAVRELADELSAALPAGDAEALGITVRHAFAFPTWLSLKTEGLDDAAMADLVCGWIRAEAA